MHDFSQRADLTEWMDEPCSPAEFRACLRDLERVNRWTLAYRPTLAFLERVAHPGRTLRLVDVGSGGGDMLRRIERWAAQRGSPVELTGVDLNPHAEPAAKAATPASSRIQYHTGDAFSLAPGSVDVVISSLFTHHLSETEIVRFLRWMETTAVSGWFINDLERAAPPYYGFRLLAGVMRWHRFVRHDGPVSIRRAFREQDWVRICTAAGLDPAAYTLEHWRPARLCISRVKQRNSHEA